ncbi:MAG: 4-hydroxy-tetrahydrodipicolinate synthase [Firmicutes bacterium]|nr:4-hydroxy-tetrahydrodipicolinate synthase [Bacillota bacterium]
MITPFTSSQKVNYEAAAKIASYLVKEQGSEGIVVTGTTGESPTLSVEEKIALYRTVKKEVGSKAMVIAGTGSYDTKSSIELTLKAAEVGVDGFLLVAPYYNKPSQKGLLEHFKAIAEVTTLPVIIYNVPSRTGVNISADTCIELSFIENIVGVKEASGDLEQIAIICRETEDNFLVYSGDDSLTLPILSVGGIGVISVASHLVGKEIKKMIDAYKEGRVIEAASLHQKLMPLFKGMFMESNPVPVKESMRMKGFDVGLPRLPLVELSEEKKKMLEELLQSYKLI